MEAADQIIEGRITVFSDAFLCEFDCLFRPVLQVGLNRLIKWAILLREFGFDLGVDTKAAVETLFELRTARIGVDQIKAWRCLSDNEEQEGEE